ncbi:MAG TPA: hypothetical protein VK149_12265 [Sideroxyarcus sp.]|nr:hypothetical protein [Sideroxyarcus sp.]
MKLKISVHEFKTSEGEFIGMNAGEYTGVFAPLPADEATRAGMVQEAQRRAEHLMAMKDASELPPDCDMTLAEIKASIRENIVEEPKGATLCVECFPDFGNLEVYTQAILPCDQCGRHDVARNSFPKDPRQTQPEPANEVVG